MPIGMRFTGQPGNGPLPPTGRPGGTAPFAGPIQDCIQREAQADDAFSRLAAPRVASAISSRPIPRGAGLMGLH
jgi:hypothetical protein